MVMGSGEKIIVDGDLVFGVSINFLSKPAPEGRYFNHELLLTDPFIRMVYTI